MNENNNIEIAEEDVKLADYIYSILKFQPTILLSWGIQRPVVIKLGLAIVTGKQIGRAHV